MNKLAYDFYEFNCDTKYFIFNYLFNCETIVNIVKKYKYYIFNCELIVNIVKNITIVYLIVKYIIIVHLK